MSKENEGDSFQGGFDAKEPIVNLNKSLKRDRKLFFRQIRITIF